MFNASSLAKIKQNSTHIKREGIVEDGSQEICALLKPQKQHL